MSHYTVLVAIEDPARLAEALDPFDENKEVEPWKCYETGAPAEHWSVRELREKGKLPAEGEITWPMLAAAHNEVFPDEKQIHVGDEDDAYTMSTYNGESKWDWYVVGGRWRGYFPVRAGLPAAAYRSLFSASDDRCDGGPKGCLDLEQLRSERATEAMQRYAHWMDAIADTEEARPWCEFAEEARAKEAAGDDQAFKQARELYHAQPRVMAAGKAGLSVPFGPDVIEEFSIDAEVYVERARARAVPGFATLTTDGRWMAPGTMGWWATTDATESTRAGYGEVANAYIDSLSDETYLILVDCHI